MVVRAVVTVVWLDWRVTAPRAPARMAARRVGVVPGGDDEGVAGLGDAGDGGQDQAVVAGGDVEDDDVVGAGGGVEFVGAGDGGGDGEAGDGGGELVEAGAGDGLVVDDRDGARGGGGGYGSVHSWPGVPLQVVVVSVAGLVASRHWPDVRLASCPLVWACQVCAGVPLQAASCAVAVRH